MTSRTASANATAPDAVAVDNMVFLRGRLADTPELKELPSGDTLVVFRLTVDRPPGESVRVDSLECSTVRPRARRTLQAAQPGDVVEVEGALRRRFWRSPNGPASRYAVDASVVRINRTAKAALAKGSAAGVSRAGRADRRAGASPARKPASG